MDGMTILVAGLVGAGGAGIGVVLLAMSRRRLRGPVRRGEPRSVPGQRPPGARPAPGATRVTGVARGADARSRAPGAPVPGGHRGAAPPEALGGETLQLGPVPAWRLPVEARPEGVPARRGSLFGRRRGSEYTSASAVADEERATDVPRIPRPPSAASVANNASRRHDPRTAPGRSTAR